jgi:hypothetical protein
MRLFMLKRWRALVALLSAGALVDIAITLVALGALSPAWMSAIVMVSAVGFFLIFLRGRRGLLPTGRP